MRFVVVLTCLLASVYTSVAQTWIPLEPAPLPNGQVAGGATNIPVSGRVTAIAVHPTNPNTVSVGTAQGGVYSLPE